tara:strand:- start:156 stop:323 length:168 start_codon:yes stop_codon:yes gene_type:complete
MVNLSISNYEDGTLNIYLIPLMDDYETYITDVLGYSLSNIEWFIFNSIVKHEGSV